MNLHDVVQLVKPAATRKSATSLDLFKEVDSANELFCRMGIKPPEELFTKCSDTYQAERLQMFHENGMSLSKSDALPRSFYRREHHVDDADFLTKLNNTPRTNLRNLHQLTDKLGMVIMPFHALTPNSLRAEEYPVRCLVGSFNKSVNAADLQPYVIAPLELYDIHRHIDAVKKGLTGEFYSKEFGQVFTTIQLQMPLFSLIFASLTNLDGRVKELETVTQQLQIQVDGIQQQLKIIQDNAERRRKEEAAERDAMKAAMMQVFHARDPLLFAIPKSQNLHDGSVTAVIGPCWGPDFSQEMADLFELSTVIKQRDKIMTVLHSNF